MIFLKLLLEEIDKQKQDSIDNIEKTDLYTKEDICKILKWYGRLSVLVKNSPPLDRVAKIRIKENDIGEINSIAYVYGDSNYLEIQID